MLNERQVNVLRAAVNGIIPADDFPGGWEGGVGNYLFRQFERDLKEQLPIYAAGLDALDGEAKVVHGSGFAALAINQQDEVLGRIEVGDVRTDWTVNPVSFFQMLTHHCAEGFYSDPGNGGNHGEISWKMIGFEVRDGNL